MRAGGGAGPASAKSTLVFQRIKSVADLNEKVAAASAAGKPVMLDFYADWCASCKEMEKYVFTDAAVQGALANVVLLQADVTANNDDDKGLFERFEIFGPPTIAFFDATATAKDGQPYRNTYTWYLRLRDGAIVEATAFFDTIEFNEFWSRVSP